MHPVGRGLQGRRIGLYLRVIPPQLPVGTTAAMLSSVRMNAIQEMLSVGFFEATWLPFLPGHSWAGVLVWLLVALGLIGFLISLFRE